MKKERGLQSQHPHRRTFQEDHKELSESDWEPVTLARRTLPLRGRRQHCEGEGEKILGPKAEHFDNSTYGTSTLDGADIKERTGSIPGCSTI
jgi:hypothetical protein